MLSLFGILVLSCGVFLGAPDSEWGHLSSQPVGKCWLRTDCPELHPGFESAWFLRTGSDAHLASSTWFGQLSSKFERSLKLGSAPSHLGNSPVQLFKGLARTAGHWGNEAGQRALEIQNWCRELAETMQSAWEQLDCARTAKQVAASERRYRDYWDYYAAWDRWISNPVLSEFAFLSPATERAMRNGSLFDRHVGLVLVEPPQALRRVTSQFGCWAVSTSEDSAARLLNLLDQLNRSYLAHWLETEFARWGKWLEAETTRLDFSSRLPERGLGTAQISNGIMKLSRWVEQWVLGLAGGVQAIADASLDGLSLVPVEAIGQVWPE
jgi:hypothetical protein